MSGIQSNSALIKKHHNAKQINLVRYADDFIVTANSEETAYEIKAVLEKFMIERGLQLSVEKTCITNIEEGFNFLGWQFKKYNGKLLVKPSKKSVTKVVRTVSKILKDSKTEKQETIIRKLNSVIIGWVNYHRPVCSKSTFGAIDHAIFGMLWKWAKRRHPRKGQRWIKDRYWKQCGGRKWVFRTKDIVLKYMKDTPIVRHTPLTLTQNAIMDDNYFQQRKRNEQLRKKKAFQQSAVTHYIDNG